MWTKYPNIHFSTVLFKSNTKIDILAKRRNYTLPKTATSNSRIYNKSQLKDMKYNKRTFDVMNILLFPVTLFNLDILTQNIISTKLYKLH